MRRSFLLLACLCLLMALTAPAAALEIAPGDGGGSEATLSPVVQQYHTAHSIALGLSVIACLGGACWYAISAEHPHDRHRAGYLITMSLITFLLIVLDKTVVQGVSGHFGVTPDKLPEFWR